MASDRPPILSREALVPIGSAAALAMAFIAGHLWLSGQLEAIRKEVSDLRWNIQTGMGDRWTRTDMRLWISEFQQINPGVKVPPVGQGGK